MVQIVENWADIEGSVQNVDRASEIPGFVKASVELERVTDVEGFPNLLASLNGAVITVFVPSELAEEQGLQPGTRLVARARRARPGRTFVHADHVEVC